MRVGSKVLEVEAPGTRRPATCQAVGPGGGPASRPAHNPGNFHAIESSDGCFADYLRDEVIVGVLESEAPSERLTWTLPDAMDPSGLSLHVPVWTGNLADRYRTLAVYRDTRLVEVTTPRR